MTDLAAAPVVVGTDGSPPADLAVTWAADEAVRWRRPLHIVHVVERWVYDMPLFPPPGMRESISAEGERILAEAKSHVLKAAPDLSVTTKLLQETVAHALCEMSRQAFEVVLGHRGLGGFSSLLLGSTGLRVAGHAYGPVVIMRGEATAPHGEVVAGVSLSHGSTAATAALEYAFGAAAVRSARLRVLHAWQLAPTLVAVGDSLDLSGIEQDTRLGLGQALAPWRKGHPEVEIVEDVVRDHPVSALVEASRRAALTVVGTHDRTGLGALRLGSVGHGVIHHAHGPIAVIRPRA